MIGLREHLIKLNLFVGFQLSITKHSDLEITYNSVNSDTDICLCTISCVHLVDHPVHLQLLVPYGFVRTIH